MKTTPFPFCLFLLVLMIASSSVNAADITFTFKGSGSGVLGDNTTFTDAEFVITASSNTYRREIIPDGGGFFIIHDNAAIEIQGIGNLAITTETLTFFNDDIDMVAFSRGGMPFVGLTSESDLNGWDMLSSIGPFTGSGFLYGWDEQPYIYTDRGILQFESDFDTNVSFQAQVATSSKYEVPDDYCRVIYLKNAHDGTIHDKSVIRIDGIFDNESGQWVAEDVIESIIVKRPDGSDAALDPIEFNPNSLSFTIKYEGGGTWKDRYEPYYGYQAIMTDPSPPDEGLYSVVVNFSDGSVSPTIVSPYIFNGVVDLPFVDVDTLQKKEVADGFYMYWKNPGTESVDIDIRLTLYIHDSEGNYLGELYYRNAMEIERIWVANKYLNLFGSSIGKITIHFQLRTIDGLNRTYTKKVDISEIPDVSIPMPWISSLLLDD